MQRKPQLTKALVAGYLTFATSCQTESAPASDLVYETWDSAGIPIAVTTGFPSPEDRWVVEAEPFLSIGGASADPPAMFNNVTQATRLSDGRIVILESEVSGLRFFDSEGQHLRTSGGRGEGPGEFEYAATFVRLPGDTLLVDAGDRHILFSPNGPRDRGRAGNGDPALSDGAGTGHARDTRPGSDRVRTDRRGLGRRVDPASPPSGNAGRDRV